MAPRPSPLARLVGRRIATLRDAAGMTQETLAWEAGFKSKGYLSRIESGQRLPSVDVLDRIARRLSVEVRDLFVFPDHGPVAAAMDVVRRAGPDVAPKVIELVAKVARRRPAAR